MHAGLHCQASDFVVAALCDLHEIKAAVKLAALGIECLHDD